MKPHVFIIIMSEFSDASAGEKPALNISPLILSESTRFFEHPKEMR